MNPSVRTAWCIGHDRRLNHERRRNESMTVIEGRAAGGRVACVLEGHWQRVPGGLRFSLRSPGCLLGVWRWQYGVVK